MMYTLPKFDSKRLQADRANTCKPVYMHMRWQAAKVTLMGGQTESQATLVVTNAPDKPIF